MDNKEFNLLYEKWIWVRKHDNHMEKWSLLEVFKRAPEASELAGELPTQNVVVLRLLLAVMHAIFTVRNIKGNESRITTWQEAYMRWKELWELNGFPFEVIEKYLKEYEERFWLFHPEFPFYQIADIGKSTEYSAGKLIGELSESSNKIRLFASRAGEAKNRVSYDEAARWLLYVNAFDDTSAKPVKKGLPSPGAGWLGQLGLIYAEGHNLFETLLLNFILVDEGEIFGDSNPDAKAYWERNDCRIEERENIRIPESQKELLTIQSRRLQLKKENGKVIGYKLLGGDFFSKENVFIEQMTLWRRDDKKSVFLPKRHRRDKQVWRDFAALLVAGAGQDGRRPGVVRWVAGLKDAGLYEGKKVKFHITGIQYGDKDFFADDIIEDSLQMNAEVLKDIEEAGEGWSNEIIKMLELTDKAASWLGWLASSIAVAEGRAFKERDSAKRKIQEFAKEQGYQKLDEEFRDWLLSINPHEDSMGNKMLEWKNKSKDILLVEGKHLLEKSSEKAMIGIIKNGEIYSSVKAFQIFRRKLNTIL